MQNIKGWNESKRSAAHRAVLLGAVALALTGCGGGGDPPPPPPPPLPPPPPAIQTGVFKDLNVTGLDFSSGAQTGVTDARGRFQCETGKAVSFSIGAVRLGEAGCAPLVMPSQLATEGATFNLEVVNLARFLQMLDEDADPDNGIEIVDAVRQVAEQWPQVDFLTTTLDADLVTIISDAVSVDPTPASVHALPTDAAAFVHFFRTQSCAYGGAFKGYYQGSDSGPAILRIGIQLIGSPFTAFAWEALAIEAVDGFTIVIDGGPINDFVFGNQPAIVHPDIQVKFTTPDTLEGTWNGGTVRFERIGKDDGSPYRFVGMALGAETDTAISLNFDGSAFAGQAFEPWSDTTFEVTGSLTGDQVALTATGGGETFTATGTLTNDADGNPSVVVGSVSNGATLGLAACRLN
jgi:hypothetical protein